MKMLILSGGGVKPQANEVIEYFKRKLPNDFRILYIPQARKETEFTACMKWIHSELNLCDNQTVELYSDLFNLEIIDQFHAIFIGGGNIFRLLKFIKNQELIGVINRFAESKVVFGGSAGAIIMGYDTLAFREPTLILESYGGLKLLGDISIVCHFKEDNTDKSRQIYESILEYSLCNRVLAIPEDSAVVIEDDKFICIGKTCPIVFYNKMKIILNTNFEYSLSGLISNLQADFI